MSHKSIGAEEYNFENKISGVWSLKGGSLPELCNARPSLYISRYWFNTPESRANLSVLALHCGYRRCHFFFLQGRRMCGIKKVTAAALVLIL